MRKGRLRSGLFLYAIQIDRPTNRTFRNTESSTMAMPNACKGLMLSFKTRAMKTRERIGTSSAQLDDLQVGIIRSALFQRIKATAVTQIGHQQHVRPEYRPPHGIVRQQAEQKKQTKQVQQEHAGRHAETGMLDQNAEQGKTESGTERHRHTGGKPHIPQPASRRNQYDYTGKSESYAAERESAERLVRSLQPREKTAGAGEIR